MTKKFKLENLARELYVEKNMLQEAIAKQIGVSERTIRRWKIANNWDKQRLEYVRIKKSFHEDLYDFSRKLMAKLENDMENKENIASARFFTAARMLPLIEKVKAYEDEVARENQAKNKKKSTEIPPEVIRQINEEFLGIKEED